MIEQLVQNISNDNIRDFFKRKLPSFTPETEELDYILPDNGYENFSDLIKSGSAEYDNSDELKKFRVIIM